MTTFPATAAIKVDLRDRYSAPSEAQFEDDDGEPTIDFLPAEDLRRMAEQMIDEYPELSHLHDTFSVTYLWKRDGGKSGGKLTLGKCIKASGMLKYFAETTYVIWLAANHANDCLMSRQQVMACLYHELCHAQVEVDDEGNAKAVAAAHDFQGFVSEVKRFGDWMADLRACRDAWTQLALNAESDTADFKTVEALRPKPGSGIDSVTISDNRGRSVTLNADTKAAMKRAESADA